MAEMALKSMLSNEESGAAKEFGKMAKLISSCEYTRDKEGEVGWVDVTRVGDDGHSTVDAILTKPARVAICDGSISTKPGDITMQVTERGVHLVHVVDVMVDIKRASKLFKRRRPGPPGNILELANNSEISNDSISLDNVSSRRKKYYQIDTMGCQMNQADSERIEGQLQKYNFHPFIRQITDEDIEHAKTGGERRALRRKQQEEQPDLVVLNTCSIREHSVDKFSSHLGKFAKRKRDGEDVTIIVAGCVAQQEGEELLRKIPEVDLVVGPQYSNRLGDFLEDVANGNQVVATDPAHIFEDNTKPRRASRVCAWVNIIYGCNERCTYCIVPTVRGVEQSRPYEIIKEEIDGLVKNGYKEVTLLGQNVDAYGRDMEPRRKFCDLISRITEDCPDLKRLRFVTSHPRYMSLSVVDAVADSPIACDYFHIPFQSGSNEVLANMGRGYTVKKFLSIVNRIREKIPDAAISGDAIVGFPGETEEQFQETLNLMEMVKFDTVNTAAYSPRPNTPSATWENQIAEEVKNDRLQRINKLNKQHAKERRARMLGRTVEVLVEQKNIKQLGQMTGRTTSNYIVHFAADDETLLGRFVKVKIHLTTTYALIGEVVW